MEQLSKAYDPSKVEDKWYTEWMDKGYFRAEVDKNKQPFCIVMPPPNITGQLHIGHAVNNTLQDILIRWRRMQGYNALWIPGTDHASIATEAKIKDELAKEDITKYDLGREKFLERAWQWREKYGRRITAQLKRLGVSCDWSRERFTMDEGCSRAVIEVFVRLYEKGLIYRGDRIINWCPECKTALSDAEVEYEEEHGHLWHIRYPFTDDSGYIVVATTRPETMLGDTAVAVNPNDERYKDVIGKTVILPLINREISVIADEYVDMEFGTGAVKITPAHDPNDFEVGIRHSLPVIRVMADDGHMNENAGRYNGMERYEARRAVLADLEAQGFIDKTENHVHNVGHCYRCSTIVEPIVSKQWFVKMEPLAEPAIEAVRDGRIQFIPQRFANIYFNWMENIKDWCISRQLWWGHRIPAYYCRVCGNIMVLSQRPHTCDKCGSDDIEQDPDVLDTWFSSALWPFSTLGWPDHTPELDYFYPTDVLVTAYEIIFFWVARMIFSSLEHMGDIPFKYVLIHGIVRDDEGRKMSKSLGNGVDPLDVVDKYGADALRFTLVTGNAPGNDMRFYWDKVEASRNFANKIWNAARFVLLNLNEQDIKPASPDELTLPDRWILTRYSQLVEEVTSNLERFELGLAAQKLYDFIWSEYCDWYIELSKVQLQQGGAVKANTLYVLCHVLDGILRLLHPYMPFITEEIWHHLPGSDGTIMLANWPCVEVEFMFEDSIDNMQSIMDVIQAIRNIKAEMNVEAGRKPKVVLVTDPSYEPIFQANARYIERLAGVSELSIKSDKSDISADAVSAVTGRADIYIPLGELVDIAKETVRLKKEYDELCAELDRTKAKLSNQSFITKAPAAVVQAERDKAVQYQAMIDSIKERLEHLEK
jgi:valyl-tRNA synthetase